MANTYLEFSEIIENLTPEEIDWWENKAEHVGNENDDTVCYDFSLEKEGQLVWFHTDEHGNLEAVATAVQTFLNKFRVNDCFSLTWASWCSKPRIGQFEGGAIFVTAKEIKFQDSYKWILVQEEKWNKNHKN